MVAGKTGFLVYTKQVGDELQIGESLIRNLWADLTEVALNTLAEARQCARLVGPEPGSDLLLFWRYYDPDTLVEG